MREILALKRECKENYLVLRPKNVLLLNSVKEMHAVSREVS